jgi:hypothetical protein
MKHEIEIDGLPEGYRAVRYGKPQIGEKYLSEQGVKEGAFGFLSQWLIVEKIKVRSRVFECVSENGRIAESGEYFEDSNGDVVKCIPGGAYTNIWKEVTENESPAISPRKQVVMQSKYDPCNLVADVILRTEQEMKGLNEDSQEYKNLEFIKEVLTITSNAVDIDCKYDVDAARYLKSVQFSEDARNLEEEL